MTAAAAVVSVGGAFGKASRSTSRTTAATMRVTAAAGNKKDRRRKKDVADFYQLRHEATNGYKIA